jgi:hypothetical protein
VFGATEEFEVFWSVVPPDTILMMNVLVSDGVESSLCHHYESVDTDRVCRPTIVCGTDDVATVGEHGGMPSTVRGRLTCVSTRNVELLHPLIHRRLHTVELICDTVELICDLVRTQLLFPVEFVEERFVSPGVL